MKISSEIGHKPGEKGMKWEVEVVTMAHWPAEGQTITKSSKASPVHHVILM